MATRTVGRIAYLKCPLQAGQACTSSPRSIVLVAYVIETSCGENQFLEISVWYRRWHSFDCLNWTLYSPALYAVGSSPLLKKCKHTVTSSVACEGLGE